MTYTTVSTVRASSLLRRLVDLDVLDDQIAGVEAFGVGVGFGVAEETEEKLGRLDRPTCFGHTECLACKHGAISPPNLCIAVLDPGCDAWTPPPLGNDALLTLCSPTSATGISPHRYGFFVSHNILQVGYRAL